MSDSERSQFLARTSDLLASSLDYATTVYNVAHIVVPELADWCALYGLNEDETVDRLAAVHVNPDKEKIQEELSLRFPMELHAQNPVARALRSGKPVCMPDMRPDDQFPAARSPEHLRLLLGIGFRSGMAVPLVARGRVLGCMAVAITESDRKYTSDDLSLLQELGRRCALAVDNSRLYEEARRAEEVMRFVAKASSILASSLEYDATLASIARLAVPDFADACVVYIQEGDGTIRRVAACHIDPEREQRLANLDSVYPLSASMTFGVVNVLRTGRTEWHPSTDVPSLLERGWTPEDASLILELGYRSFILVPMTARGRTVGAISLTRIRAGSYDRADVAVAEDLGQRCGLAVDNARLFCEIQAADRSKDEFLSMLAHELRNPLSATWNALALLQAPGASSDARDRALAVAIRQVQHQVRLTDDLLDVSRLLRQRALLHREPLDLVEVVCQSVEDHEHIFAAAGIRLKVEKHARSLRVDADRTRLSQIVTNLLKNAVKFGKHGTDVRVDIERRENSAVVSVVDSGEGIEPHLLPHVFDLFFQADRTLDRSRGGLGLGLSLVKGLVEQHGGTVSAASDGPGKGAAFTIQIPLLEGA